MHLSNSHRRLTPGKMPSPSVQFGIWAPTDCQSDALQQPSVFISQCTTLVTPEPRGAHSPTECVLSTAETLFQPSKCRSG